MKAEIRHIVSPDVDMDLPDLSCPSDFCALVQMTVGPKGELSGESFDIVVCTPAWIGRRVAEHGPLIGRHYLIVENFQPEAIKHFLYRQIDSLEGSSWLELAAKIGRIGRWEFEDYGE
ncbi:Imm8 family immunity protein [Micromonospora sp. ATCC 39149]|uniref:Immunity protein 8 n=1 Tax=Micromonospora carbonacea TaxID=47853 RepID=A0A7D6CF11_9ACTN|nr:Imm8 family immunity protein [Micromonospora sp. ATCC 39149]QLJ98528.1 hypothetical protein HZU44_28410 [Micromonospora carbonacea]